MPEGERCSRCKGTGQTFLGECGWCDGTGMDFYKTRTYVMYIKVFQPTEEDLPEVDQLAEMILHGLPDDIGVRQVGWQDD